ncbi:MAG: DUF4276 family protein [Deltaproteobacteria bacterium]|nr:DUF4276 family protein [Deltaproteobacteria bacterium]MCL5277942.1 DUF4276 family protein [Deltaproteobacteria bacterium]
MTAYGIVVEGVYDVAALEELIKKCLSPDVDIIARPTNGVANLMKFFSAHLEDFRHAKRGGPVDKALVIRDADGKDPKKLESEMNSKITNRNYPFEVKFAFAVQELEAWLLADEKAISQVTQSRSRKTVPRVNEAIEKIARPKEKLEDILSRADVRYTDAVAREIAKAADIATLKHRCPKFKEFYQAVLDC